MPNLFFDSDSSRGNLFFAPNRRERQETPEITQLETRADEAERLLAASGEVPEPAPPTPLERISDVLLRPNYAGAGFVEELVTTGDIRRAVGRAFKETYSGLPGVQGEKETFGNVLEDLGVPEYGHVSSLLPFLFNETGKGWRFKRGDIMDITGRGAIGFGMDVPLDPLTYLSFGTAPGAGLVLRGGAISGIRRFSKKGLKAVAKAFEEETPEAVRYADWLSKNMNRAAPKVLDEIEVAPRIKSAVEKELEGQLSLAQRQADEAASVLRNDPLNVDKMALEQSTRGEVARLQAQLDEAGRFEDALTRRAPGQHIARRGGLDPLTSEEALRVARDANLFGHEVAHQAAISKVDDLIRSGASRYADDSVVRFMGQSLLSNERFKSIGAPVTRLMRHLEELPIGAQISSGIRKMANSRGKRTLEKQIDGMFNETLKRARNIPGALEARALYRAESRNLRRGNAESVAKLTAKWRKMKLAQPINFAGRTIATVGDYAALHLDDPGRFPAENLPPAVRDQITQIRQMTAEWFHHESRREAIDPRAFREHYFPHMFENTDEEMDKLSTLWQSRKGIGFDKVFSKGPWGEQRVFPTFTDAMDFAAQLKREGVINFDLKPILDSAEVLARRGDGNAAIMAADNYYSRVINHFGLSDHVVAEQTFKRAFPEIARMIKARTDAELAKRPPINAARNLFFGVEQELGRTEALRQRLGLTEKPLQTNFLDTLFPSQRDSRMKIAQRDIDHMTSKLGRLKELHDLVPDPKAKSRYAKQMRTATKYLDKALLRLKEAENLPGPGPRLEGAVDVGRLLARARAGKGASLGGLSPELRALYWMGRMESVSSLSQLNKLMKRHADDIAKLDTDLLENVRGVIGTSRRQYLSTFNEPYKRIASGPYKGLWMPQAMAEEADRLGASVLNRREVQGLLKTWDLTQDIFKGAVTTVWPAFHMRNHFSNVATTFTDLGMSAFDPRRMFHVAGIMGGSEGTLQTPVGRWTYDEIRTLFKRFGMESEGQELAERLTRSKNVILDNPATAVGRGVGARIENHAKLLNFVAWLERGLDPAQAAQRVQRALFDYDQLSPFERDVMRRMFPFYTWTRKNLELMTKQLATHPGRVKAQLAIADQEQGPEREMLPEYLRGDFRVRIKQDGKLTYVTGIDLPFASAVETAMGVPGRNAFRQTLASMTPVLKMFTELGTQRELWTGRSLAERQAIGDVAGNVIAKLPEETQRFLEFQKGEFEGEDTYSINGLKAYILFKSYALSRVFSSVAHLESDDMKSWLVDYFTGANMKEFDLSEKQERVLRNRIKTWETELINRGVLIRGRPFLPKTSPYREEKPKKSRSKRQNAGMFSQ